MKRFLGIIFALNIATVQADTIDDRCQQAYFKVIDGVTKNSALSQTLKQDLNDLVTEYYKSSLSNKKTIEQTCNTLEQLAIWQANVCTSMPYHVKVAFTMATQLLEKHCNTEEEAKNSRLCLPSALKKSIFSLLRYAKRIPFMRAAMERMIIAVVTEQIIAKKFAEVSKTSPVRIQRTKKQKTKKTSDYLTALERLTSVTAELKTSIITSGLYDADLQKTLVALLHNYTTQLREKLYSVDDIVLEQEIAGISQIASWHNLLATLISNKADKKALARVGRITHEFLKVLQSSAEQRTYGKRLMAIFNGLITSEEFRQANIFSASEIAHIVVSHELAQQSSWEQLETINRVVTEAKNLRTVCLPQ